jgi:parallel beta-helix repeat protein
VISGNGGDGIALGADAAGNRIEGNRIGTNLAGTLALPNGSDGVDLAGDQNIVGGGDAGAGNTISGNLAGGVVLRGGADGNVVAGNRIGTNALGVAALANGIYGIDIASDLNTIGGSQATAGNQISGNGASGVFIRAGANSNSLVGNRIGTDATGGSALPNGQDGIRIYGLANTVGGTTAGARNTISGNAGRGIAIAIGAVSNLVRGNRIGTDASGLYALGNQAGGIAIYSGGNTIGGTGAPFRNVVSGNQYDGIAIMDGSSNTIAGNYVGLAASGSAAIPNAGYGIRVVGGHDSLIGGPEADDGNVVSGNGRSVSLEYEAHHYTLQRNIIGFDAMAGGVIGGPGSGLEISSPDHLVGGFGAGNLVGGHNDNGIVLRGGRASGNRLEANTVVSNGHAGVVVDQAFGNTIGGTASGAGNTIAHNGYLGVFVWDGDGNSILGNSIHSNELLGIELDPQGPFANDPLDGDVGSNLGQNFPIVTSALLAGNLAIEGFLDSKPDTQYRVELFSNAAFDPTGIGEGEHFLGAVDVTTDAGGHAELFATVPAAGGDAFVTATATDPSGNTSEFSPAIAVGDPQPGQLQIWRDVLLSYEGTPGIEVSIVRSHGVVGTVTVDAATLDDSATAPDDFGALDTMLTFAPGEAVKTLFVPIVTDGLAEGDEKWHLDLANPTGGAALGAQNHVLAWLFDATLAWPLYSIGDAEVVEGDGGTKQLIFTITLSATDHDVPIRFWTLDGTATAGEDYAAVDDEVVFHPGEALKTVEVPVFGDAFAESDEILYVRVAATQGTQALVWDGTGTGRILDDDGGDPNHIFSDDFESGDSLEWSQSEGVT